MFFYGPSSTMNLLVRYVLVVNLQIKVNVHCYKLCQISIQLGKNNLTVLYNLNTRKNKQENVKNGTTSTLMTGSLCVFTE